MLEEIIRDRVDSIEASNQPMFDSIVDYEDLVIKRTAIVQDWKNLPEAEQKTYKGFSDYIKKNGGVDLKDPALNPAKNLFLIRQEVSKRLLINNLLHLLPIDDLDFTDSLLELAECIENVDDLREVYKIRKRSVGDNENAGISAHEAMRIKNCFIQGRELYLAGCQGSLMVRPLNFFYALTAYSYGVIILNNPLRYRKDMIPGSHGMSYLPNTIEAQFGGDSARGTFSDLVTAFPTQIVKTKNIEFHIDCTDSLQNLYKQRFVVSLGTLLSIIPEMSEYYQLATNRQSRCYPLNISTSNDARSLTWEFHVGDGQKRPNIDSIETSFPDFIHNEKFGKIVIQVPAEDVSRLRASIYTDIRGNLWFIENPFKEVLLPEIAVHFLISSMFSNIMRYRPDEWGSILTNEVPSSVSLLTRHYFSSFQRKFLISVLGSVSRYIPFASRV